MKSIALVKSTMQNVVLVLVVWFFHLVTGLDSRHVLKSGAAVSGNTKNAAHKAHVNLARVPWFSFSPPPNPNEKNQHRVEPKPEKLPADIRNAAFAIPKPTIDPPTTGIPRRSARYSNFDPTQYPSYWSGYPQGYQSPHGRQLPFIVPSKAPSMDIGRSIPMMHWPSTTLRDWFQKQPSMGYFPRAKR